MSTRFIQCLIVLVSVSVFGVTFAQDRSKIIRRSADDASKIEILDAVFGQDERVCDARKPLARACDGRSDCEVEVGTDLCGDPYRGVSKELFVAYSCGDGRRTLTVSEDVPARLYCRSDVRDTPVAGPVPRPRNSRNIGVLEVAYGADDKFCDATSVFSERCDGQKNCSVEISNRICGRDPASGRKKDAYVRYSCRGNELETVVAEGSTAQLSCD